MTRNWNAIPKQTFLVEDGKIGDCWRCCIAAVLGLPAEMVPHFLMKDDGTHNHECDADTQLWLCERGYRITYANSFGGAREALWFPRWSSSPIDPPVPLIGVGPTQRSKGLGKHHAVVMIDGKIVYDPHPSEAGLTAIIEQYLIFKPVE
ncbi:MAG: hypothetical protein C0483_18470 [Pirellula sp.]|nr:hypothetical protein [Pirellula sp.]